MARGFGVAVEKHTKAASMAALKAERSGGVKELATAVMELAFALRDIGMAIDVHEDMLDEIKNLIKKL